MANQLRAEEVKQAAAGRMKEILAAIGVPQDCLDGKEHPCPKCGGETRFGIIRANFDTRGGILCSHCKYGGGDIIDAVQNILACSFADALARIAEIVGLTPTHSNGHTRPASIIETVARAKCMPLASFVAYGAHEATRNGGNVARLPVYNSSGEPFSYFDLSPDDKGKFKPGAGNSGIFLPEGKTPKPGETWLVVEGPKDAAALHGMEFLALGTPGANLHPKYCPLLAGCHVVIVPDRDVPSVNGAELTAARLYGIAASVKIAHLPAEIAPSKGFDVRDVIKRDGGPQFVLAAIANAQAWKPPSPTDAGEKNPFRLLLNEQQTDIALAERLVALCGQKIRFVGEWERWVVWTGRQWKIDIDGEVDAYSKDVARELWGGVAALEKALIAIHQDAAKARSLSSPAMKLAKYASSRRGIEHEQKLARSEPGVPIAAKTFDADPWLLNCANGVVDLREGTLAPHDPELYLTKLAPVKFIKGADCPRWRKFVAEIMGDDQDLIDYLQRLVGYSLTGCVNEHILPICYGTGGNGKSVFLNTIHALLGGDYAIKAAPDLFMAKKGAHPTERADLFGKRLVTSIEANEGQRLDEAWVKEATGGDVIRARRMHENFWEFAPTHKVWLAVNHRPEVRGGDMGIWRRLQSIPFEVQFSEGTADKDLPLKLLAELPGILNWAVMGCIMWRENGMETPEKVMTATKDYRDEQDVIGQFIKECCIVNRSDVKVRITSAKLYAVYQKWTEDSGEKTLSKTAFGRKLNSLNFETDRDSVARMWKFIDLKPQPSSGNQQYNQDEGNF